MPYCPNTECPHRKSFGESAEYLEGTIHSSDCGSILSEDVPSAVDPPIKKKFKITISDFQKRILFTLGLLALWRVTSHITVPGINPEFLDSYRGDDKLLPPFFSSRASVFSLGLMPYISAYILVELCSLVIPRLTAWRKEGYAGRAKLLTAARIVTVVLAILQGYLLAIGLEQVAGGNFVSDPGIAFRIITMLTMTAGTFLIIWIADQITIKGIGNGISMLFLVMYAPGILRSFTDLWQSNQEYGFHYTLRYAILFLIVIIILVALIVLIEKGIKAIRVRMHDGHEVELPIKLTTAGRIPAGWASFFVMQPAVIVSSMGGQEDSILLLLADALTPGKIDYLIVSCFFIVLFYYLFTPLFHRPGEIVSFLKDRNAAIIVPSEVRAENHILQNLKRLAFWGSLYLCSIIIIPKAIQQPFGIYLDGISLLITVVIALDVLGELVIRWHSSGMVKVAEFQEPYKAGFLKNILQKHDVPCHLQGYYHRALLYFFGPYLEISILVPGNKAEQAVEIINRYFGDLATKT